MTTAHFAKYAGFSRISAREARRERNELYGRMVFFAVILGVFSSLWRAVREAGMPVDANPKSLVWYLAATEWILLSAPPIHLEIQEAIRRGDVVYRLGHPVSYVLAEFASALGLLAVRAPFLGATAFLCAFAFTGWAPPLGTLLIVVPFGLAASALVTAWYLGIGLLAPGCRAGVLGVAKADVRARRPDAAASVVSGVHSARRGVHALSVAARGTGVIHAGNASRAARTAGRSSRLLELRNGISGVVDLPAGGSGSDDQWRLTRCRSHELLSRRT